MTANLTQLPNFHTRQEGEGYVVYLPDSATYLYADDAAHEALIALTSKPWDEAAESIAAMLDTTHQHAHQLAQALVEVLTGRLASVGGDQRELILCPLSQIVGADAERCETFGMPL